MPAPRRKSPRLKHYDYTLSAGYFITICTHKRQPSLGTITDYHMTLTEAGKIALNIWDALPRQFDNISLDARVVMPNHVHGIIIIDQQEVAGLSHIVSWYKYQTTVLINNLWGA